MSNYYEYRDVKVMMALELMKRDGWKVYGYYPDNSDPMTDYFDPADWSGLAEKNGYILVVDRDYSQEPKEIKEYTQIPAGNYAGIQKKLEKLQQMTVERGASEQEAASAENSIKKLLAKLEESKAASMEYTVVGMMPGHMANPPRCNWHIEKDGMIIAKGNGLLKFASIHSYFYYDRYREDMMEFKRTEKETYVEQTAKQSWSRGYYSTQEDARKHAEYHYNDMKKKEKLFDQFNQFIGKLDTTAGGLMGSADFEYQKVTVTEYKTENKAVESETGEIKEGQCIILKSNFTYGCSKGLVYRIHARKSYADGSTIFTAIKLNRKLTKECTGKASQNNYMFSYAKKEDIQKWIDKGAIAFCEIQEVKTPYTVEKVVKVPLKKEQKEEETKQTESAGYTYTVKADTDTRDGSALWVVRILEKLTRDEYKAENEAMKARGGYYSKFKHGFIFRFDPSELLSGAVA